MEEKNWFLMSCVCLCMTCVCIRKDNLDKANIAVNIKSFLSCFILSLILMVTLLLFYCITINVTEKKLSITQY